MHAAKLVPLHPEERADGARHEGPALARQASDQELTSDIADLVALKDALVMRRTIADTMSRNAKTRLAARALTRLRDALDAEIAELRNAAAALKAVREARG